MLLLPTPIMLTLCYLGLILVMTGRLVFSVARPLDEKLAFILLRAAHGHVFTGPGKIPGQHQFRQHPKHSFREY